MMMTMRIVYSYNDNNHQNDEIVRNMNKNNNNNNDSQEIRSGVRRQSLDCLTAIGDGIVIDILFVCEQFFYHWQIPSIEFTCIYSYFGKCSEF